MIVTGGRSFIRAWRYPNDTSVRQARGKHLRHTLTSHVVCSSLGENGREGRCVLAGSDACALHASVMTNQVQHCRITPLGSDVVHDPLRQRFEGFRFVQPAFRELQQRASASGGNRTPVRITNHPQFDLRCTTRFVCHWVLLQLSANAHVPLQWQEAGATRGPNIGVRAGRMCPPSRPGCIG